MKSLLMIFTVSIVLLAGATTQAFDPLFETTVHYPAIRAPYGLSLVDLNNDGILDYAAAGDGRQVMLLAGDGEGGFVKMDSIPTGGSAYDLTAGDIDGDLDIDLVIGSYDTVYTVINQGGWNFQMDSAIYMSAGTYCAEVQTVDIDNDTDLDLVFTYPGMVCVSRNDGSGNFGTIRKYASPNSKAMDLADYDGDGDIDIAVANTNSDNFAILMNDADTSFLAPATYSIFRPYDLEAANLNGDAYPDLIVVNYGNAHTFFNDGDGTFTQNATYSMYGNYPDQVISADLNGDAITDFAVANEFMCIFLGTGGGAFQNSVDYVCGYEAVSLGIGDIDGDSDPDLVGGVYSGTAAAMLNNGDGTFPVEPRLTTGTYPGSLCAADFDKDGNSDIAVTNQSDDDMGVYFGNGDMTFDSPVIYSVGNSAYGIEAVDLDGDTWPDLVVADTAVSVYMNNGDGSFASPVPYHCNYITYIESGQQMAFADVTGNGNLDAVVAADYYMYVFEGNGDGTFQAAVEYEVAYDHTTLAIADMDNNGTLDVVLGCDGDYYVYVALNDGGGVFGTTTVELYLSSDYSLTVALGDFDGDGWTDIASGLYDGSLAIIMNNGDSTFTITEFEDALYGEVHTFNCYDIDKDGDLDLLPMCQYHNAVSLYENDGFGNFTFMVDYATDDYPYDMALADYDNDGDMDIATVNYDASTVSLLQNLWQDPLDVGEEDDDGLPRTFALSQNYPNPFNPGTTIEYDLPRRAHVTLTVINILGQEVRTLVNAEQAAGPKSVRWDGRDDAGRSVASGVYFYRLTAGETVEAKKMILLK